MNAQLLCLANRLAADAARTTMAAIYHLDSLGATVREIDIRSRRPLIRIDPPAGIEFLRGALRKRITDRGTTRTVYVTTCHGATVEWEVRHHTTLGVAQA